MNVTPYPLAWPDSMPRAKSKMSSKFRTSLSGAMNNVSASVRAFANDSGRKLESLVISSNVTLGVSKPKDTGVAVWFIWDGMQVAVAVDRYDKIEDNLQAIHHILESRRTELRHGGLEIVRATFKGFLALPAPTGKKTWREVMNFGPRLDVGLDDVETVYRSMAKQAHPDSGVGSGEKMAELNRARDEARRELAR